MCVKIKINAILGASGRKPSVCLCYAMLYISGDPVVSQPGALLFSRAVQIYPHMHTLNISRSILERFLAKWRTIQ